MINDTVAAVSTPHGKGGVAMIRISGADTKSVIERAFVPRGSTVPAAAPRRAVFGAIRMDGETVDEGVCTFFAAPASYTGEDVAEITCHGGVAVTARVLEAVFRAGASPAGPGEFTRRAFINGKLTLSESEAIGLLIDADTTERAALAASAASGALSAKLNGIADGVIAALSALYAAIDYPDEDIGEIEPAVLADSFDSAVSALADLGETYRRGSAIVDGVPTAIVGAPNVGKSSLYNAICGHDAAIVTNVAGTTRDVLSEVVSFGGVTLLLRDTAGLRDSSDEVEKIGVERAISAAESAALVFFVYDISRPLDRRVLDYTKEFAIAHPDAARIAVLSKSDLSRVLSAEEESEIRESCAVTVEVSVENGEGIDALSSAVGSLYDALSARPGDAVIWSAAQSAAVARARELLAESAAELRSGGMPDAACTLAESALAALMQIDGRGVSEEIVRSIFARFCVGK